MLTQEQMAKVCAAARAYKGTPFRGQGRDKRGLDCTGLVVMAYRDAGLELEEPIPDYQGVDSKRLVAMVTKYADRLPPGTSPLPADVVVYGRGREAHLAMILDGNPLNAIHCPVHRGVVEARFDPARGEIRGIYRWR